MRASSGSQSPRRERPLFSTHHPGVLGTFLPLIEDVSACSCKSRSENQLEKSKIDDASNWKQIADEGAHQNNEQQPRLGQCEVITQN